MKNRLLVSGLLFLCMAAQGQIDVTNKGILFIKSNAYVFYTVGSFTNSSSAKFTNDGSSYIKGDVISNQASMSVGTGTVYLNGSSVQTISGTQPFRVYNLNTNNAAGIVLNTDLSISGVHTFSSGMIITSSTPNYLIYEAGSSYTGASDSRHVNGWVKKIGGTDFIFPVGSNNYLREISLQNLSVSSEFNVSYSGMTFNATNVLYPIASVNPMEQWTVNKITGGSARVQLNWDSSKVPFPNYLVSDLRAALYSGSWINEGGTATGSVATTGNITSSSSSSFGRMAIGSISFPLPLKFVGVSAVIENSSVRIKWQTANESGVQNYYVQKSVDGISFSNIATLDALNTDFQSYEFLDAGIPTAKMYYRIRANDVDGTTRYSKVVLVTADNIQRIQMAVNPVKDLIQLSTQNIPASAYSYQLINSAGQVCKKGNFTCNGSSYITIPVNNISPGQYTLVVLKAGQEKQFKVLIQ